MTALTSTKITLKLSALLAFATLGLVTTAQAGFVGHPTNIDVGCDNQGECSITLDNEGNISGEFNGFFGPYDITLTNIAPTVNPAWLDVLNNPVEVTSYLVKGIACGRNLLCSGIPTDPFPPNLFPVPVQLSAGALGLCEFGVAADGSVCTGPTGDAKRDVLIFTPLNIDTAGFGFTRIDFLSANIAAFLFPTDFNVLEVDTEGSKGAVYEALPPPPPPFLPQHDFERMTYNIITDRKPIPEPSTLGLFVLGAAFALRRKLKPS